MPKRISRITLQHFRGATSTTVLEFDPKKPMVMLFGENGTGKSTIIDAIDAVCNKKIGSLADRSSTSASAHLPSIGYKPADLQVELTLGDSTWTATLARNQINVQPEAAPPAHILRRSHLLRLVEAAPADRYNALKQFIDVEGVERSEASLNAAMRSANARLESAIQRVQDASDALDELWQAEGRPGGLHATALQWAQGKTAADPAAKQEVVELLEECLARIAAADEAHTGLRSAESDLRASEQALTEVQSRIDALERAADGPGAQLVRILSEVQTLLDSHGQADTCPVCEQPIRRAELQDSIRARLEQMNDLSALNAELQRTTTTRDRAAGAANGVHARFIEAGRELAAVARSSELPEVVALSLDQQRYQKLLAANVELSPEAEEQSEALLSALVGIRPALKLCEAALQADLNQFNAIQQDAARVLQGKEAVVEENAVYERLSKAHDLVHHHRIRFTQTILDGIAKECKRLYDRIHPGEPLGLVGFRLDETKRSSLHQQAEFQGYLDVPPQAYFSESHLDTLGFCLFLAFARFASQGDAVIVLDDIFTSVDAAHLTRIVDLLTDECEHFNQILITTHSRQWRDLYRYGQAATGKCSLVELHHWSNDRGVRHYRSKLAIDELEEKLQTEPLDRQGIASSAGVLLEAVLDHLTILYRCGMPRTRDNAYTLGELSDGVKKLSKQLVVRRAPLRSDHNGGTSGEPQQIVLQSHFDSIGGLTYIRNQVGGHFNLSGAELADAEVERFGRQAFELVSALMCPGCHEIPRTDKGSFYRCACGQTQMSPLKLP